MKRSSVNIVFVSEICGWLGGVEQSIADATRLRARGHACYLAYRHAGRDASGYATRFDDTAPFTGAQLRPLLTRWQADVVYVHKLDHASSLLSQRTAVPIVRYVHDHDLCCPRSHRYFARDGRICDRPAGLRCLLDGAFLKRSRGRFLPWRLVNVAGRLADLKAHGGFDRLIVASRYMRDLLVRNGLPHDRIARLPPAVDLGETFLSPPPGDRRVLYVGQLVHGKGVDLLLESLAMTRGEWFLDIVGMGHARSALEKQARRLGLTDRIVFHGWLTPTEQGRLYRACDIAVVPSRWPEPFGMVGLQAMLWARPVVAFDVGGISDWLDHGRTGLCVPEQDVRGLAAAVDRLLSDKVQASDMGRSARRRVQEQFSFARYLRDLEALLATAAT